MKRKKQKKWLPIAKIVLRTLMAFTKSSFCIQYYSAGAIRHNSNGNTILEPYTIILKFKLDILSSFLI